MHVSLFFTAVAGSGHSNIKEELRSIMRPEYSGYSRHLTTPRRGKGKHKAPGGMSVSKAKRVPVYKNVNIIRFMEKSPREFGRSEKDIVFTFFYELSPYMGGDDILEEIVKILKESRVESYDFSSLAASDIAFVKCTGKVCRVPQTASVFEWSPEAVRSLAGQGDIYLRLMKCFVEEIDSFDEPSTSAYASATPAAMSPTPVALHTPASATPIGQRTQASSATVTLGTPASATGTPTLIQVTPASTSSSMQGNEPIDLTEETIHPDCDEEFPPFTSKSDIISGERLNEIFGHLPTAAVDIVVTLCANDTSQALKILLGGPNVPDLIRLLRKHVFTSRPKKLTIFDEEELIH